MICKRQESNHLFGNSQPDCILMFRRRYECFNGTNSGRWWGTGRPGMLWSMGSQRVGHSLAPKHTHRSSFYQQATFSGGHVLSKYRPRSHELKPGERAFIPLSSSKLICNNLYGLYVTELSTWEAVPLWLTLQKMKVKHKESLDCLGTHSPQGPELSQGSSTNLSVPTPNLGSWQATEFHCSDSPEEI